jgi:hypothetical protein
MASPMELQLEAAIDLFSEKPLIYARTAGGYTLYSVGPNMRDDDAAGDDLVASLR